MESGWIWELVVGVGGGIMLNVKRKGVGAKD